MSCGVSGEIKTLI